MEHLYEQLRHFGLSEKEVRVYTSALRLGPVPVQVIGREAGVNRATTYVQIASLTSRGLMSSYDQGKKRLFVAEPPDRLMAMYEDEMHTLKHKEEVLQRILPELKRLRPGADTPVVRLFEGQEGLETVRQELLHSTSKTMIDFHGVEHYQRAVPQESRTRQKQRVHQAGIHGKVILSAAPSSQFGTSETLETRVVNAGKFDAPGEIAVFDDTVVMLSYKGDPVAVEIKSKELSKLIHSLMLLAWEGSKQ